jgi:hypothetical protein
MHHSNISIAYDCRQFCPYAGEALRNVKYSKSGTAFTEVLLWKLVENLPSSTETYFSQGNLRKNCLSNNGLNLSKKSS